MSATPPVTRWVAFPRLITGVPERMLDGDGSVPCKVIAVQVAVLNVSPVLNTGLKSKENNSDSGTSLYENWLILRPYC